MSIQVSSPDFRANDKIPTQFTGEGRDSSPAVNWSGLPPDTREIAMIVEDPDAPRPVPFVHWVIYKIPATATGLPASVPTTPTLQSPAGAMQGKNDFPKTGYGGPMPPKGHGVHHYHFQVYALDQPLNVQPGLDAKGLRAAMKGRVLAEGEMIGTYERKA
jgi:hypothetical protein